ncbi:hypothetical protein BsIDN1_38480 [Bacillus safensis]|uniref:Uncharacterized protein n=1 Tax=Bacillus safensis TaxID=561879 RepID=A0A5S9M9K7_BACIA|nr:hypothetical protein BsIDN1_38480 [Bacillus safensis]
MNLRCIQSINTNYLLWKNTLNKWRILYRFIKKKNAISWLEKQELDTTFVVMPKTVAEVLGEKVFSQKDHIFSLPLHCLRINPLII